MYFFIYTSSINYDDSFIYLSSSSRRLTPQISISTYPPQLFLPLHTTQLPTTPVCHSSSSFLVFLQLSFPPLCLLKCINVSLHQTPSNFLQFSNFQYSNFLFIIFLMKCVSSCTLLNTCSFVILSIQLIFSILLQHHISNALILLHNP